MTLFSFRFPCGKLTCWFTTLLLLCLHAAAQYDNPFTACDQEALATPGKVFRRDKTADRWLGVKALVPEIVNRTDQIAQVLKESWPGQIGFDALYSTVMRASRRHFTAVSFQTVRRAAAPSGSTAYLGLMVPSSAQRALF